MRSACQPIPCIAALLLILHAAGCPAPADEAVEPASQSPALSSASEALVVATWNVEWLFDEHQGDNYSDLGKQQSAPSRTDWQWKRDQVAGVVAALQPNVVALQEVEGLRTLWYVQQAVEREHGLQYRSVLVEGRDVFTEQDVGLLVRGTDLMRYGRREQSSEMFQSERYYNVSKHLEAELRWTATGETVHLFNIHLRARDKRGDIRRRQSRLIHAWLAPLIASGANVIVLGDTNSETEAGAVPADSDLGALMGKETESVQDDLVDLNEHLNESERQTHLLDGKQFDRILVSRPLVEDDPQARDLVFQQIRTRRDLVVRGAVDSAEQHWDQYWQLPSESRDLSDHYPVVATFVVR